MEESKRSALLDRTFALIGDVVGDVVECGVKKGDSLSYLAHLALPQGRRVWGFDSWEPDRLWGPYDTRPYNTTPFEDAVLIFRQKLLQLNIPPEAVRLVKGWFHDTLPRYSGPTAYVHVDCDIYESYKSCLENLWPKLSPGGVMVFDEYHEVGIWPGAKRAVGEYLATVPHNLVEDYRWYAVKL